MVNQAEKWGKILYELTRGKEDREKERIIKKMIEILRTKRRLYLLPRILESYQRYLKRKKGILIFARELDKGILEKIKRSFSEILKESKILEIKIDKNIIGGFILKTQNFLIDASLRGIFKKIKEKYGY